MTGRPTAEKDPDYGDTEGRKPNDNQGGEIITDCCLAAEILEYNKPTILNNCVCGRMSFLSLATRLRCNARKPMYKAGTKKHVAVSKGISYVLSCLCLESRTEVIASSRRAIHRKQQGMATMAPRSTTDAIDILINRLRLVRNLTDVTPRRRMHCLVSEPKDGVNAMDEITKKQPGDDRRGRDVVIMDWCWKNQDEEKYGEEGKNREFNTHGSGKSPKRATLKRRRELSTRLFLEQKYTSQPEGSLGNKAPQLCMFTECEHLCNCCLRGTSVSNKRLARWKTMCTWGWSLNLSRTYKRTKGHLTR